MQGDPVHAQQGVSALASRVRVLQDTAARTRALRDRLTEELSTRRAEVSDLSVRIEQLSKVGELFRTLMDRLVEEQSEGMDQISRKVFSIHGRSGLVKQEGAVGRSKGRI